MAQQLPVSRPGARLALFPPGGEPARRRRRLTFVAIYVATAAMLTWPAYTLFSGTFPLVLGLPLSLVWVILALAVIFFALAWLYRSEPADPEDV